MPAAKLAKDKAADALRSIGEAARELDLQTHVLRYWEGKFPRQLKPIKRADGRRLFRPADMEALRAIQTLVHERGMTLKGAKSLLTEQGVEAVLNGSARLGASDPALPDAADSPARDLQQRVSEAFAAPIEDAASSKGHGSRERLKTALFEMADLKRRLGNKRTQWAA